jgi:hypothetical protein
MDEYKEIVDRYSLDGYHLYSKKITRAEWGDISAGKKFLEKYWLPLSEYNEKGKLIQANIFINQVEGIPELSFSKEYKILALGGGCLFTKKDFTSLQECILEIGEKNFFIIENDFGGMLGEPPFRMKFPANISWEEFFSGNFVSSTIIESIHKEFFVFGESALWGKYSAADYEYPLDILGFKPEYRTIFEKRFKQTEAEREEIQKRLPYLYNNVW